MTTPYSNAIELSKETPNEVVSVDFKNFVEQIFNKGKYQNRTMTSAILASDAMDSLLLGKTPELPQIKTSKGLKIKKN